MDICLSSQDYDHRPVIQKIAVSTILLVSRLSLQRTDWPDGGKLELAREDFGKPNGKPTTLTGSLCRSKVPKYPLIPSSHSWLQISSPLSHQVGQAEKQLEFMAWMVFCYCVFDTTNTQPAQHPTTRQHDQTSSRADSIFW